HQSGWVAVNNGGFTDERHASLWSGSAATWVDLNPAGASDSICLAMFEDMEVGSANFGGQDRAFLWNSAANSYVDLSSYLPNKFADSYAENIWRDASGLFVTGFVYNNATHVYDAVL